MELVKTVDKIIRGKVFVENCRGVQSKWKSLLTHSSKVAKNY